METEKAWLWLSAKVPSSVLHHTKQSQPWAPSAPSERVKAVGSQWSVEMCWPWALSELTPLPCPSQCQHQEQARTWVS